MGDSFCGTILYHPRVGSYCRTHPYVGPGKLLLEMNSSFHSFRGKLEHSLEGGESSNFSLRIEFSVRNCNTSTVQYPRREKMIISEMQ